MPPPTKPQIHTVADLYRGGWNMLLICKCGRHVSKTPYALSGQIMGGDGRVDIAAMEAVTIEDLLARVKCSSCGGREVTWTPMRRG